MEGKKEPPKIKSVPRQLAMKIAFDANYSLTDEQRKELAPCISCKNRLDLPCEGCDHWEMKQRVLGMKIDRKGKVLVDATLSQLESPSHMRHRIIEAIMAEQHKIEEELDSLYMDHPEWGNKAAIVEGLKMAIEIARKV